MTRHDRIALLIAVVWMAWGVAGAVLLPLGGAA